ncbi:MAG: hypothetical protein IBX52_03190 [Bacterioplanes sp.]|nr:hypothetical protein [Bacterioplanes sp.]
MPSLLLALEPLTNDDLDAVHGQGGVYLTGEFTINKDGGPLWYAEPGPGQFDDFGGAKQQRNCGSSANPKECGLRVAYQLNEGWLVLDDVTGGFAFEGLTLRTSYIATDEKGDAFDKEVVEIGLPKQVRSNEFRYTLATSSSGTWVNNADSRILSVRQDGTINMQGNLLLFPVEVP